MLSEESDVAAKVFVVYDSKYGNTRLVAEQIVLGLREVEGVEAAVGYVKEIDAQNLVDYDALIFGAPNHMGKPSRTITRFIDGLAAIELNAKWAAAFDTYFQRKRYFEKATKKLERQINEKLPNLKLITAGLSIKVNGVNGPVADGELPKAKEFGKKIACLLTS